MTLPHIDSVRASLRKRAPYLRSETHDELARGLVADGLARDGDAVHASVRIGGDAAAHDSITARIEAAQADPQKARSLKLALGEIRRFGIKIDASGMVDPLEVSKQMKAAGVAPETIIQMKANLHAAGFLD